VLLHALGKIMPVCLALAIIATPASAQWSTIAHKDGTSGSPGTTVAYTINKDGYSLEIYIDSVKAVRSRFSLPEGMLAFPDKFCPSYQIDRGNPVNRSMNDALCISTSQWVEYIIGHADDQKITSTTLLALMNGNSISFMFELSNHDYRQTSFSLKGSKRAMTAAFGEKVSVSGSP
jgi:hypothetical protein